MREGIIKFIIIALVAFFSASMVYAENHSWFENKITIGYELNHFNPTKVDSTKVNNEKGFLVRCTNKRFEEIKYYRQYYEKIHKENIKNGVRLAIISCIACLGFYIAWFISITLILGFIGVLMLMTTKIIKII